MARTGGGGFRSDHYPRPAQRFVLNTEANVEIDMTALDALDRLRADLEGRRILFAMARGKQYLRDALRRAAC
jgi:sulfate permease, SulP family